jgi:hypothetical protein
MPMLTLTVSGFREASVCPPTMDESREKPVTVAAFSRSGIVTRYSLGRGQMHSLSSEGGVRSLSAHPNEYRAWTSWRRPVSRPPIPINAGGIHVRRAKNKMISDASRRDMPMLSVASMPVGMLSTTG